MNGTMAKVHLLSKRWTVLAVTEIQKCWNSSQRSKVKCTWPELSKKFENHAVITYSLGHRRTCYVLQVLRIWTWRTGIKGVKTLTVMNVGDMYFEFGENQFTTSWSQTDPISVVPNCCMLEVSSFSVHFIVSRLMTSSLSTCMQAKTFLIVPLHTSLVCNHQMNRR